MERSELEHHETLKASDICGTRVENWEGEDLGLITDVMINKFHGDVAYFVLSYPGVYGRTYPDKRFAVPFESIAMKINGPTVQYILNTTEDFLRRAPGFDQNNWPDFANPQFGSVLKDYYKDISVDIRV